MSMRRFLTLFAFALALLGPARALAELKIGYVDLQRAMLEVEDGRRAKAKLQALVDQQKKTFDRDQDKLLKEREEFDKQFKGLSPEERVKRQTDLGQRMLEFTQRFEKEKEDLVKRERTETQAILDKMFPIVARIAQREGMTFVFEKNKGILFAPPFLDITNELVRIYNDQRAKTARGDEKTTRTAEPKGSRKKK
jgi:outer membrane protein